MEMIVNLKEHSYPIYTEKNILVEVDGTVDIDEVFAAIVNVLGA